MGKVSALKAAFLAGVFLMGPIAGALAAGPPCGYNGLAPTWEAPTEGMNIGTFPYGAAITPIDLSAVDPGDEPITYYDDNSALAQYGLAISGSQIIGTPSGVSAGTYGVALSAYDCEGLTSTINVSFDISSNGISPTWNEPAPWSTVYVTQDQGANIFLSASEGSEDPVYFSDDYNQASDLGLTVNNNGDGTGSITGYPAYAGTTSITITAYDQGGDAVDNTFTLEIAAAPPVWQSPDEGNLSGYGPFTQNVEITPIPLAAEAWAPPSGPMGLHPMKGACPIIFEVEGSSSLPPGLSIADDGSCNYTLAGIPTDAGTFSFALVATETMGYAQSARSFSMTIAPEDTGGGSSSSGVVDENTKFRIRKSMFVEYGQGGFHIQLPSVSTGSVTDITETTATGIGTVVSDGGAAVIARGIAWSTSHAPTLADSTTTNGSGVGAFTAGLTGLSPGMTYYVRAYATNSVGTAYGSEVSFTAAALLLPIVSTTSPITSITQRNAVSGGEITDDGGTPVTAYGVVWSTSPGPTTADSSTNDGAGTGSFSSTMTALSAGTTYYVRAYATNGGGTAYGSEESFSTPAMAAPVIASTTAAYNISQTAATSGGDISSDSGSGITAYGNVWGMNHNPTLADASTDFGPLPAGFFDSPNNAIYTSAIAPLTAGTTYYVRAYATNAIGTTYGDEISFTTNPVLVPTISSTTAASNITTTTADSGGNITANGGGAITAHGVVWSMASNPTLADSSTDEGAGAVGPFTSSMAGLSADTTYHVRAYATNSAGTAYGPDISFATLPPPCSFAGGDGSPGDPYQITTKSQLVCVNEHLASSFILNNDIDMAGTTYDNAIIAKQVGTHWDTFNGTPFTGNFDGNGFAILNLTINTANSHVGLFGQINAGGQVHDLAVTNADLTSNTYNLGVIAGRNYGTISACTTTGSATSSSSFVGGIAGRNFGAIDGSDATVTISTTMTVVGGLVGRLDSGTITNSHAHGNVSSSYGGGAGAIGGLVGATGTGTIAGSSASGNVSGNYYIGGLVGENASSVAASITNSHASGTVQGSGNYVGGLIGNHQNSAVGNSYSTGTVSNGYQLVGGLMGSTSGGTIINCYSTSPVHASYNAGGLVGVNYSSTISNSYAAGAVTITDVFNAGGFAGENSGTISNSYSIGAVTCPSCRIGSFVGKSSGGSMTNVYATGLVSGTGWWGYIGGLVGEYSAGAITNSFWDTETTGQATSTGGGTGKTTAEMQTLATFTGAGWDAVAAYDAGHTWFMAGYPKLSAFGP